MQMLSGFPAVKFGLMVGIGGGIPSDDNDIRLGDVVVSKPEGTFDLLSSALFGRAKRVVLTGVEVSAGHAETVAQLP